MTLKEGGRDPKQNPSPASLTSLLISAQISTRFSAVLESPFSAAHQKLLTHIEDTVVQPQLQTGTAVPAPLLCRRGAPENLAQTPGDVAATASLLCPCTRDRWSPTLMATSALHGWGDLVKERTLFTRKGTEFQQLRQR